MDNSTYNVVYNYYKLSYAHSCRQFNKQMLLATLLICTSIVILILNISYTIYMSFKSFSFDTSLGVLYYYNNINNSWYYVSVLLLCTGLLASAIYFSLSSEVIFKHDDINHVMPRSSVIDALSKMRIRLTYGPYFYLLILPNIITSALLFSADMYFTAVLSYRDASAFDVLAGQQGYQVTISGRMIDRFIAYCMQGASFYRDISWTAIITIVLIILYLLFTTYYKSKFWNTIVIVFILLCCTYFKEFMYSKYVVICMKMPIGIVYIHYGIYLILLILSLSLVRKVGTILHKWILRKSAII